MDEDENAGTNVDPLETIRTVLRDIDHGFAEENDMIRFQAVLPSLDVDVFTAGTHGDQARVVVKLPVRARSEVRALVGEFLHRLNFSSPRKLWEMDYDDGEIRLAAYTDTFLAPLSTGLYRAMLSMLLSRTEVVFPYLTSVLSRRMTPEFAADQAEAAIEAEAMAQIKADEDAQEE